MQKLKVAASALLKDKLQVEREVVCLSNADFTEVSAVVIDIEDYRKGGLNKVNATALEIPVFLYLRDEDTTPEELVGHVVGHPSTSFSIRSARAWSQSSMTENVWPRLQSSAASRSAAALIAGVTSGSAAASTTTISAACPSRGRTNWKNG